MKITIATLCCSLIGFWCTTEKYLAGNEGEPTMTDQLPTAAQKLKQHRWLWDLEFREKEDKNPTMLGLLDFLEEIGPQLDCYFTVERLAGTAHRTAAIEAADVPPGDVATIEELIAKLRNDLEEVTVIRSGKNPTLIRLVETPLTTMKQYPLDQKISLTFSGTLSDLVKAIHEQVPAVIV